MILAYTGKHQKQLMDSIETEEYLTWWGRQATRYKKIEVDRFYFMECIECGTSYPILGGKIKCNGREITKCPYCK